MFPSPYLFIIINNNIIIIIIINYTAWSQQIYFKNIFI